MSAEWLRPGALRDFVIEWKARQYRDPVKKLAYLKRAANIETARRKLRLSWYLVPVFLVLLFGASRVQTVTEVNAGLPGVKQKPVQKIQNLHNDADPLGPVWAIESGSDFETYSNGLRIENRYLTKNEPRSYVVFRNGTASERYTRPAGIIFHTTESLLAPFNSDQNERLTKIGRELLEFVSRRKAYHFVIDRFGRVFRIVPETDFANHAGYSVWADQDSVYVNLNHSFLGISFEARTRDIEQGNYLSSSQIHSGHLLVEMLVGKYRIPLDNCITHAQVSVDPKSMTIGYHYDGAGDFPFQRLGVPDNYALPIPSLFVFGFDFDSRFLMYSGNRLWKGMRISEQRLRRDAELKHRSVEEHKEILRQQYRVSIESLKHLGIIKEN